jgi:hypothetical protein
MIVIVVLQCKKVINILRVYIFIKTIKNTIVIKLGLSAFIFRILSNFISNQAEKKLIEKLHISLLSAKNLRKADSAYRTFYKVIVKTMKSTN